MNRSYTAHSPYSLSPTERIPSHGDDGGETVDLDRERYGEYEGLAEYEDYDTRTTSRSIGDGSGSPAWPARFCSSQ